MPARFLIEPDMSILQPSRVESLFSLCSEVYIQWFCLLTPGGLG